MNIALFEDAGVQKLLPLTWLRATFELRCGCDLLIDKVRTHLPPGPARVLVRAALGGLVEERTRLAPVEAGADWCLLNGRALVTGAFVPPAPGVAWQQNGNLIAAGVRAGHMEALTAELLGDPNGLDAFLRPYRNEPPPAEVRLIEHPWQPALLNADELRRQWRGGEQRGTVDHGAHLLAPGNVHIAAGARVKAGAVLDAEDGPIHVAEGALVQPSAVIEGPCYIGPQSIVRPTTVIRGGTTLGPVCRVGGEIEASIFQGYSNKQHAGYIGHSYVASWVNLGANTVTSDLKNTYGAIRVSVNGVGVETGEHFIGAMIGDHAKTGIATILPTGCVIGVAANVFTQKAVPRFVPSFAWLTDEGVSPCRVEKILQIAQIVMGRRDLELSDVECDLLRRTAELARQVEAVGWE